MIIKISKEALLHDISNLAYVIADVHCEANPHARHQLTDICQEGNIDRVARILGLACSVVRMVLHPVLKKSCSQRLLSDFYYRPRDYVFEIDSGKFRRHPLELATLIHEYLVWRVIAEWLAVTMPEVSLLWKEKAKMISEKISQTVADALWETEAGSRVRPLSPF